jgi:hypothetical protein
MKRLFTFIIVLLFTYSVYAQTEKPPERASTFAISISQENAFGFYPAVFGSFGLNESSDFTYYGIFWTNPSFGLPQTTFSSDLWLETGFGYGFDALNGTAYINPSLGFTHGKFLSGGTESVAFEGYVPSVIAYFFPGSFDGEIYIGYYGHLREESANTYDFLFYWFYPGIWVSDKVSIGIHYEGLFLNYGQTKLESAYQWLGPYIKLYLDQKYSFRFSAGPNLKEGVYASEFYKLSVYIPLL